MRVSIDKEILEKIVNYIATKPYSEVWQLIGALQQDIKPETGQTQPAESEASKP